MTHLQPYITVGDGHPVTHLPEMSLTVLRSIVSSLFNLNIKDVTYCSHFHSIYLAGEHVCMYEFVGAQIGLREFLRG